MNNVFKEHTFPKYNDADVMKPQMNGLDDPTLRDFALLDTSAFAKAEFKEERFEEEFIRSFLNATMELAKAGRTAVDKPGMYVFYMHSYALPVLYLARHCMELSIKRAIRKCGFEPKKIHGLKELWDSLVSRFPRQRNREDRRVIKNMGNFVAAIASVDNNGISLRYPKNKSGSFTQDRTLFVNGEQVASYLEMFVGQLELVDFDSIKQG